VTGIFRYSEHVTEILEKLPTMKQGRARTGQSIELPEPPPSFDSDGNVLVDAELVITPKVAGLGKPIWQAEEVPAIQPEAPADKTATEIARLVTTKAKETRQKLKEEYGLTVA